MPLPYHTRAFSFAGREILLLVPDPSAAQAGYLEGKLPLPYWSQVWPAALGLTQFLSSNIHLLEGKKVLELAAGLGLPSFLAASFAAHVTCSDYLEEAAWFIRESAKLNRLTNVETRIIDWRQLPADLQADVVLLSDINYEPAGFAVLHQVLEGLLQNGCTVVLSTPQRLAGRDFIKPLLPRCQQQEVVKVSVGGSEVSVNVFVLKSE